MDNVGFTALEIKPLVKSSTLDDQACKRDATSIDSGSCPRVSYPLRSPGRYTLLRHSKERQALDGLSNLNYSPQVSRRHLYTNISVSLTRNLAPIADY